MFWIEKPGLKSIQKVESVEILILSFVHALEKILLWYLSMDWFFMQRNSPMATSLIWTVVLCNKLSWVNLWWCQHLTSEFFSKDMKPIKIINYHFHLKIETVPSFEQTLLARVVSIIFVYWVLVLKGSPLYFAILLLYPIGRGCNTSFEQLRIEYCRFLPQSR